MSNLLPHGNCYYVAPRLIAGEYPGGAGRETTARIERHLDAGITAFLDLTEAGELAPYDALLARAATARELTALYRRMPIADFSVPRSPADMGAILDAIDGFIAGGHTVYLHCWGGVGRTGTVVGCWLVRHGLSGDEALAAVARHWHGLDKAWRHPRSPESDEQHAYVRGWRDGRAP